MINISRICILIVSLLVLGSCIWGWGSDWWAWLSTYKWDGFALWVPSNWDVLEASSWILPTPSSGEIVLAASSTTVRNGFSNNIIVLEEETDVWTSSEEFTKVTYTSSKDDYYYHNQKEEKSISFSDEWSSTLYIFEAKYNKNTPSLQFLQTGRICWDQTYLMTIAVWTLWNSGIYENILKTFECK